MSYSLDYIYKLNKEHKELFECNYNNSRNKDSMKFCQWKIVKKDNEYCLLRKHDGQYYEINYIQDLYKIYSGNPMWYITNISMLKKIPKITSRCLLEKNDWSFIKQYLWKHELEEFKILRLNSNDLGSFLSRTLLTGSYQEIKLRPSIYKDLFYKLLISKDTKKAILVSDLKLVVNEETKFRLEDTRIKHIKIENIELEDVKSLLDCFNNCKITESIEFRNFDTSKVKNFRGMFSGCKSLRKVNIDSIKTDSAIILANMFESCESLENLDLNHFRVETVTEFTKMFTYCKNLKELKINKWVFNKQNLKYIIVTFMFTGCDKLEDEPINIVRGLLDKQKEHLGYVVK